MRVVMGTFGCGGVVVAAVKRWRWIVEVALGITYCAASSGSRSLPAMRLAAYSPMTGPNLNPSAEPRAPFATQASRVVVRHGRSNELE